MNPAPELPEHGQSERPPPDIEALLGTAEELYALAGPRGAAEAVQTTADAYPGATTCHVVYDLGVALSLALGDLAQDVEITAQLLANPVARWAD